MIISIAGGIILAYLALIYGIPLIIAGAYILFAGICWCGIQIGNGAKWFWAQKWYYKLPVGILLFCLLPDVVKLIVAACFAMYLVSKFEELPPE